MLVVILWNSCGPVTVLTANKYGLLSRADNFGPGLWFTGGQTRGNSGSLCRSMCGKKKTDREKFTSSQTVCYFSRFCRRTEVAEVFSLDSLFHQQGQIHCVFWHLSITTSLKVFSDLCYSSFSAGSDQTLDHFCDGTSQLVWLLCSF